MAYLRRKTFSYPPAFPVIDREDPINQGLMAWWRGDRGDYVGNTLRDISGNSYTLSLNSAPDTGIGAVGNAFIINGTTQYGLGTDNFPTGSSTITLSFWIYYTSKQAYCAPISKNAGSGNSSFWDWGLLFNINSNDLYLIRNGANLSPTGVNIPSGVWSHVTAVIGIAGSYFYLNGVLKNTQGGIGSGATLNTVGRFVQVAGTVTTPAPGFTGSIDEIRIHNRALYGSEISRMFSDRSGGLGLVKPRGRFAQAPKLVTWLPRAIRWGR